MTDIKGKNIFITGASGFIGSYTALLFLLLGAEVYGLIRPGSEEKAEKALDTAAAVWSRKPSDYGLCNFSWEEVKPLIREHFHPVYGDIHDIEGIGGLPDRADLVLHFAWGGVNREEIDDEAIHHRSMEASLSLVRLSKRLGTSVFMDAGSRVEYGIKADGIMEESMDCAPINAYGRNKLLFYEQASGLCRELSIEYYHLRFFSVYGRGDHPWSIISTLTRELPKGETVSLSACRHSWNFMEVRDAAYAVAELYRSSFAGRLRSGSAIVNIASGDERPLKDFVEEIYELSGRKGSLSFGTFKQAKEGALSIIPSVDRLRELTDGSFYERMSFSEGIGELLKGERYEEDKCPDTLL